MIVVVMGVSGAGKTTIGQRLAQELGWPFIDADQLHPATNLEKLAAGIPLEDADRILWLKHVQAVIDDWLVSDASGVLACSALKASYREMIWRDPTHMRLVYLQGSPALIAQRLVHRQGHFMNPLLLPSQFQVLEPPIHAITIDVARPPEQIVRQIRTELHLEPA